jgi:hypothetical protein
VTEPFEVVRTADLELVFWPDCGGRLISLRALGVDFLWRNPAYLDPDLQLVWPREAWVPLDGSMGSWANVGGSKTWPAPQGWAGRGEWPGPPDDRLDSGSWVLAREDDPATGEVHLSMTSPEDDRTGLRITREFWVPRQGTAFRQRNTFTNVSDEPVRWSIWEVCQVDTEHCSGGSVRVGTDHSAAPVRLLTVVGEPSLGTVAGDDLVIPLEDVVGKLGIPSATRHVTLARPEGRNLEIGFTVDADADYPDGGSRAELWLQFPIPEPLPEFGGLHPRARLVELEVLSPLRDLGPGESAALDLSWRATQQ